LLHHVTHGESLPCIRMTSGEEKKNLF
jgi:hypothetical protein